MSDTSTNSSSANPQSTNHFKNIDVGGLERIDIRAAARNPKPILDFIIPGMLAGTVALMVGPGGVSKSMLALQTAAIIATGLDHWSLWSERQPFKRGRVAVFNIEDQTNILQTRVHEMCASPSVPMKVRHLPPRSLALRVLKDHPAHAHANAPDRA